MGRLKKDKLKKLALITGASSGIGKELAKIHASQGGDLILVARRHEELRVLADELTSQHAVEVRCISKDLSVPGAARELFIELGELAGHVDILMNNAGFGGFGSFADRPIEKELEMIRLNISALTELTHLFLPSMIERKSGKILNTASSAGFMPGPMQSVYFATKAYVVSFTQGVHHELKKKGVTVTALCPGPVKTEFEKTAGLEGVELFKLAVTPTHTARVGYAAMQKGKMIVFDQKILTFSINWIVPLIPRSWLLRMIEKMQTPKR
jgi:short-subunit dehydrogenase